MEHRLIYTTPDQANLKATRLRPVAIIETGNHVRLAFGIIMTQTGVTADSGSWSVGLRTERLIVVYAGEEVYRCAGYAFLA